MHLYDSQSYMEELRSLSSHIENILDFKGKTILISGITGMIGSLIADALLYENRTNSLGCQIIGLARNPEKAEKRFRGYTESDGLSFVSVDINNQKDVLHLSSLKIDYIIHAASNTHPVAYATDPVGTELSNILGTDNLLRLAVETKASRFLFLSSVEIYGENRGDVDRFDESYLGYIDCNSLRAAYPEGKRAGEALCNAYAKQHDVAFVTARLARVYGPTLQRSDTKAMSQFLWNALEKKPIVLKSAGTQQYSYLYASDAARGILWLLTKGESGQAYNISGKDSDVMLKDLAGMIADVACTDVVFELPDAVEAAGFSKATKAMLDADKIHRLGFDPVYNLNAGLLATLKILNDTI